MRSGEHKVAREDFLEMAKRAGLPIARFVAATNADLEPKDPVEVGTTWDGNALAIAWWSLRMRYWAWRVAVDDPLPTPDIQVFAIYHPDAEGRAVPDSLGLSNVEARTSPRLSAIIKILVCICLIEIPLSLSHNTARAERDQVRAGRIDAAPSQTDRRRGSHARAHRGNPCAGLAPGQFGHARLR